MTAARDGGLLWWPAHGARRLLLVAERPCLRSELEEVARGCGSALVVATARAFLHPAVQALAELGLAVSGEVGPRDPLRAATEALEWFPADEVVLAFDHPAGDRAEAGLLDRLTARYPLPVHAL